MADLAIRRMTLEGLRRFSEWAATAAGGPVDLGALEAIASDPACSEAFLPGEEWEAPVFERKIEMGRFLAERLSPASLDTALAEPRVWTWLSIVMRDSVMPMRPGGREVGDVSRHVVEKSDGLSLAHRHLVRGAVVGVTRFGDYARTILAVKPSEHSKIEEAIMSRREIVNLSHSTAVAELVDTLYYNPKTKGVRRGAKGTGYGSINRLIHVLTQMDRCYDIASMSAADMLEKLPRSEFDLAAKPKRRGKAA